MTKQIAVLAAVLTVAPILRAVETKSWVQNAQEDFEKGRLERLSLRSDGRLMLAPVFKELYDSGTPYLWALAVDSGGNLYAGGGGPSASTAKLFAIDPAGKVRTVAELPGMEIHALAIDREGTVYAGTSPDGKVYRVAAGGKADVYYDPKEKYIWAMAFNSKGELFVATGDQGQIHRVAPGGKGNVFFRSEETHARSLAVDAADNVIAGTEPGGLILRVSPAGEGFVLYQSPKREVTAVAAGKDGMVYAAAAGTRTAAPLLPGGLITPPPVATVPIQPAGGAAPNPMGSRQAPPPVLPIPSMPRDTSIAGGSELYRIEKDGYPRKIWSSTQDIVYAIALDASGRPVLGTGNRGIVYRVESENASTHLINAEPTQVTALASGPGGRMFAATGNIGKIYQIGPGVEQNGVFESDSFDAGSFAYWGRLNWRGDAGEGRLLFETRSGNLDRPQKNWSVWSAADVAADGRVKSPSARFLQYRVSFRASAGGRSPELNEVDIAYMPKNVPPVITQIEITPANYKFATAPTLVTGGGFSSSSITLAALGQPRKTPGGGLTLDAAGGSDSMQYSKGWIGARWAASDPNNDSLIYKVEVRGAKETEWKLVRDKVREKKLSWDSTAYADGEYQLRVTAADTASNPPQQALKAQLESDLFLVDNTSPQVTNLAVTRTGAQAMVRWKARDAASVLAKAEYALDGGDWTIVEPTSRLTDSQEHEYSLMLDNVAPGEHTIAVRVSDEFDNQTVEKIVFR